MRTLLAAVITLSLLVGCADDRSADAGPAAADAAPASPDGSVGTLDGGPSDGGPSDGGPSDGGPPDAGAPLVCSEPDPGGDCVLLVPVGSFGPLNSACLPRCSAATGTAYRACSNQSCRAAATQADTTPGAQYFIGRTRVRTPMDCEACVSYQEFHCFSLVCGSEVDAYVDHCIAGVSPSLCDPSITAIDRCLATLDSTEQETLGACFESADGPRGCFACE